MTGIARIGLTFPPDLLKDFDEITGKMGYRTRSKAVQDAARMFISEKEWLQTEAKDQAGVLMMVYDHSVRGLESSLIETQHHYAHVIFSTLHVHLSKTECLEVIAVKGSATVIRKLANKLTCMRGVKLLKTTVVPV